MDKNKSQGKRPHLVDSKKANEKPKGKIEGHSKLFMGTSQTDGSQIQVQVENENMVSEPNEKTKIVALMKTFGGEPVPLTKNLIVEKMDSLKTGWNDPEQLLVHPIISEMKHEGPINLSGMPESLNKGHTSHVKGADFEIDILRAITKYARTNNFGWKIFHDVHINEEKLEALSHVFNTEMPSFDQKKISSFKKDKSGKYIIQLEVDLINISQSCIYLIEIKSNDKEAFKAMEQLQKSEYIFRFILKMIGIETDQIPIQKAVAIPFIEHFLLEKKAKEQNVKILTFKGLPENLTKVFSEQGERKLEKDDLTNILIGVSFMKCSKFHIKRKGIVEMSEHEIENNLQEIRKGTEIIQKLGQQQSLAVSKHPNMFLTLHRSQVAKIEGNVITLAKGYEFCPSRIEIFDLKMHLKTVLDEEQVKKVVVIFEDKSEKKEKSKSSNSSEVDNLKNIFEEKIKNNQLYFVAHRENLEIFQEKDLIFMIQGSIVPEILTSSDENIFVWLDPVQTEIMHDKNPKQIIIGSASTGKTLLILLKVIEILKINLEEPVLIILPYDRLVQKFENYFSENGISTISGNLMITTPKGDWVDFVTKKNEPHIFVDEYSAANSISSSFNANLMKVRAKAKPYKHFWVTMDIKQNLEGAYTTSNDPFEILNAENTSKRVLPMVHRCTKNVFMEYKEQCDDLVETGHQLNGTDTETIKLQINTVESDGLLVWAKKAREKIDEYLLDNWKPQDICVILSSPDNQKTDAMILFYLKLKEIIQDVQVLFESETLSQEWPLVVICFQGDESLLKYLYISQSRAIYKLVYILYLNNEPMSENVLPPILQMFSSTLSRSSWAIARPNHPSVELFLCHQEIHNNFKLKEDQDIFVYLWKNLQDIIASTNRYVKHTCFDLTEDMKQFEEVEKEDLKEFFKQLEENKIKGSLPICKKIEKEISIAFLVSRKIRMEITSFSQHQEFREKCEFISQLLRCLEIIEEWQDVAISLVQHWTLVKKKESIHNGLNNLLSICKQKQLIQSLGYAPLIDQTDFLNQILEKFPKWNPDVQKELKLIRTNLTSESENYEFIWTATYLGLFNKELSVSMSLQLINSLEESSENLKEFVNSMDAAENNSKDLQSLIILKYLEQKTVAAMCKTSEWKCFIQKLVSKEFDPTETLYHRSKSHLTKHLSFYSCKTCCFKFDPDLALKDATNASSPISEEFEAKDEVQLYEMGCQMIIQGFGTVAQLMMISKGVFCNICFKSLPSKGVATSCTICIFNFCKLCSTFEKRMDHILLHISRTAVHSMYEDDLPRLMNFVFMSNPNPCDVTTKSPFPDILQSTVKRWKQIIALYKTLTYAEKKSFIAAANFLLPYGILKPDFIGYMSYKDEPEKKAPFFEGAQKAYTFTDFLRPMTKANKFFRTIVEKSPPELVRTILNIDNNGDKKTKEPFYIIEGRRGSQMEPCSLYEFIFKVAQDKAKLKSFFPLFISLILTTGLTTANDEEDLEADEELDQILEELLNKVLKIVYRYTIALASEVPNHKEWFENDKQIKDQFQPREAQEYLNFLKTDSSKSTLNETSSENQNSTTQEEKATDGIQETSKDKKVEMAEEILLKFYKSNSLDDLQKICIAERKFRMNKTKLKNLQSDLKFGFDVEEFEIHKDKESTGATAGELKNEERSNNLEPSEIEDEEIARAIYMSLQDDDSEYVETLTEEEKLELAIRLSLIE